MKIFISSVTLDFEALRHAAAAGVATLGHRAIRAEEFGASPESPRQACLAGVRDADMMILILGAHYGPVQASGLSATHEEYREARDTRPVLVFLQRGVQPEPRQDEFIREVRGWEQGHFTTEFNDAEELRDKVIRALHDYILANEAAPLDEAELARRARALVPGGRNTGTDTDLTVALAGGPLRAVLRPAELESEQLRRFLLAEALTGEDALLTPASGTEVSVRDGALQLIQNHGTGLVSLDEAASLLVVQPAVENNKWHSGITSLIEEVIIERITRAIRFCARVLDHVDSASGSATLRRSSPSAAPDTSPGAPGPSTSAAPCAATMGYGSAEPIVVVLSPPVRRRAALRHDTQRIAEDLTVRLRREVKP